MENKITTVIHVCGGKLIDVWEYEGDLSQHKEMKRIISKRVCDPEYTVIFYYCTFDKIPHTFTCE